MEFESTGCRGSSVLVLYGHGGGWHNNGGGVRTSYLLQGHLDDNIQQSYYTERHVINIRALIIVSCAQADIYSNVA